MFNKKDKEKMQGYSEVTLLKAQIDTEAKAAQRGMCGLAQGVSRHQFITLRMERMGILHERLKSLIGGTEATQYLIETIDKRMTSRIYSE
jgi:hypothetical protein